MDATSYLLLFSGPTALALSLFVLHRSAKSFDRNVIRRSLAISTFVLFSVSFAYALLTEQSKSGLIDNLSWLMAAVFGFYFGYRTVDRWAMLKFGELVKDKENLIKEILDQLIESEALKQLNNKQ